MQFKKALIYKSAMTNVLARGAAVCIGTGSAAGKLFKHTDAGASTNWTQI
jgi:hypothetical protein